MEMTAAAHGYGARKHSAQHLLPQDIIEDILLRLAVKPLSRFRCVSKSWLSLINSKTFIKTHLQNSTKRIFLFSVDIRRRKMVARCAPPSLSNKKQKNHGLNIKCSTNFPIDEVSLVGCCSGLVCVLVNRYEFILWNPSTRISKKLSRICKHTRTPFSYYGLGCDESSGDYNFKVIAIVSFKGPRTARYVYSSKSESWKKIYMDDVYYEYPQGGVLVREKLHWLSDDRDPSEVKIDAFDLKREEFGVVEVVPYSFYGGRFPASYLGVLRDLLLMSFSLESGYDIWVMKDYGVQDSWEKVMVIDNNYFPLWTSPSLAPLCIGRGGKGGILYTKILDTMTSYVEFDQWCRVSNPYYGSDLCIESLVSPL